MPSIFYRNRQTNQLEKEQVYGASFLKLLYGDSFFARFVGHLLRACVVRSPWFSALYGWWQRRSWSKRQIPRFMKLYGVKAEECAVDPSRYASFNAFFTRHLRAEARPIDPREERAIIPADGRYLVFPSLNEATLFGIKGSVFNLHKLIQDPLLAERYLNGTLVLARLCPSDYHRFHFPCRSHPSQTKAIPGSLYSVNPIALWKRPAILWENKRVMTELETQSFGKILYIEVGATNVGTIHQTFIPGRLYEKGEEKGYFSFGGSTLLLLFEKGKLKVDADLLEASLQGQEMLCLMGQSLGESLSF